MEDRDITYQEIADEIDELAKRAKELEKLDFINNNSDEYAKDKFYNIFARWECKNIINYHTIDLNPNRYSNKL
jgi:hypothetical protein